MYDDWHWDEKSKTFAVELGEFLLAFCDYLEAINLSTRNLRNHRDNVQIIGMFTCNYGYYDEFDSDMFESGEANFEYEFKRKITDSPTALSNYRSTWKHISRFVKSENYELFLEKYK
ncbi:MAG: hypothetical protein U5N85_05100 [Arcicella sp.]|nr:hypothetical protein [Arcicella sp.]